MKKLNLGCGQYPKQGYVNLDMFDLQGIDIVHNLNNYPYPFNDNEFDEVLCHHVLEHLDDIVKPLEEIWRITRNRAKIIIKVPIYPGIGAVVDPTHKSFYTFGTFDYFTSNKLFDHYTRAEFQIIRRNIIFSFTLPPLKWLNKLLNKIINVHSKIQNAYFYNFSYLFSAYALHVELETVKHEKGIEILK
jgi:SAM-dependent methyltransferase